MTDGRRVRCTRQGPVLVVELDRSERRNAVDARLGADLAAAMAELDADDELAVAVLAGGPADFSVGFDLATFDSDAPEDAFDNGFVRLLEVPPSKPVIAAVEGVAAGAGFELVLACDIVIASATARFALPEVRRGLVAGGGGLLRLGRRIAPNVAMALALTGDWLGVDRAHELGLVLEVVGAGAALQRAVDLATVIAAHAPLAVAATKRVIRESAHWPEAEAFERQRSILVPVISSDDAVEGARAFVEKRAPRWTGA